MALLKRQAQALVHENVRVQPGDKVALLPSSPTLLKNQLGEGPFTILWIGKWPCGKVMLYLKGAKGGEPGAFASDFMRVT